MADLQPVEHNQAFEQLPRDLPGVGERWSAAVAEVLAEVAVWDVFHRDKNRVGVIVPSKYLNEEILVLVVECVSCNTIARDHNMMPKQCKYISIPRRPSIKP